jgi:CheY-like chemotaxis protein
VDDDPINQMVIEELLAPMGFKVWGWLLWVSRYGVVKASRVSR